MTTYTLLLKIEKSIIGVLCIGVSDQYLHFEKNRYSILTMMYTTKNPLTKYLSLILKDATFCSTFPRRLM